MGSRRSPLNRLRWFLIFAPRLLPLLLLLSFASLALFLLLIFWHMFSEFDINRALFTITVTFGGERRRGKLLNDRFSGNLWQDFFQLVENFVKIDAEVGLFIGFLLQELLEFSLFFVHLAFEGGALLVIGVEFIGVFLFWVLFVSN